MAVCKQPFFFFFYLLTNNSSCLKQMPLLTLTRRGDIYPLFGTWRASSRQFEDACKILRAKLRSKCSTSHLIAASSLTDENGLPDWQDRVLAAPGQRTLDRQSCSLSVNTVNNWQPNIEMKTLGMEQPQHGKSIGKQFSTMSINLFY